MQTALERGWPLAILVQIREKTQNEIQHGADQATPSIRRETNYVEQDESEETENQNMGPQGLADEGERIHNIVDEMEAEDQTAIEMEEYEGSSDDEQYSLLDPVCMKYIFTYVFSYIFECRYGDGLLARPSYRLEP